MMDIPQVQTLNGPCDIQMAEHFFGYGRWDAPYWFVGPEAGMAKSGDSLELRYESWKTLEYAPVVDCAAHHRGFGFTKWHEPHPPTQATWRQLIRLLLSFKSDTNGTDIDIEAIRAYQRDKWGSSTGETCVIELSGLASPNMGELRDRTTFLSERIMRIQEGALAHSPKFIVMYGVGQREEWERIAGAKFVSKGTCRIGNTLVAIVPHPVTRGLGNEYWVRLGRTLRGIVGGFSES
jgi:hypothetical protein